jgi:uncharacterized protein (DUF1800 family)
MEAFKTPFAVILCSLLSMPVPPGYAQTAPAPRNHPSSKTSTRSEYHSTQLQGDARILQALNRFTFGPRPGDLEAVRAMGLENWFNQQLRPESIDQTDLNARLAQFPAMQWTPAQLLYYLPGNAIIRQAIAGKAPIPQTGVLHSIYEDQIFRIQAKRLDKTLTDKAQKTAPGPAKQQAYAGTNMNAEAPSGMAANDMGMTQSATRSETAASRSSDAASPAMNSSGQMDMNAAHPSATQPAFDQASIQQILALAPGQRVAQLAAMQPEEFDGFITTLKPVQRIALNAGLTPNQRQTVGALENPERMVGEELLNERLTRDIYSNAQLQEVMTDFWLNHFNIYLRKNEEMPYYLVSYARDTIRPRSLGKFEDLLEAVAHSPAMLVYLDNAESIGPDSLAAERAKSGFKGRPGAQRQAPAGLNENYGRELMELHTLGVNGGYTQADVTQVARVLTGWTIDRPLQGADFTFNPNRHEPGTKTVLGTKIKENGELEGRALLHMLATRPATAQFICGELAVRFVSDNPPQSLVDRMAKSYLSSGGDIAAVLKTLFHSPEFWSTTAYRAKVKTPLEFIVSAVRASNANIVSPLLLANTLRQMGMPLYGSVPPTGYDWKASAWVSTGALVDRMNFALTLAANRLPGVTMAWAPLDNEAAADSILPTPESEEARLASLLIPGGVSESTQSAALEQFKAQSAQAAAAVKPVSALRRPNRAMSANALERQDQLLAGLLLGSPEFQRR